MSKKGNKIVAEGHRIKYYLNDLYDDSKLIEIFDGVTDYDIYLLKDGFEYLKRKYGFLKLAEKLLGLNPNFPNEEKKYSVEEVAQWLKELEEYIDRMQHGE